MLLDHRHAERDLEKAELYDDFPPPPPHPRDHRYAPAPHANNGHAQHLQPHPAHRPSSSEFEHAPPLSASARSIWRFGKPRSVARGYEAVPAPVQSKNGYSSGEIDSGQIQQQQQLSTQEHQMQQQERGKSWFGGRRSALMKGVGVGTGKGRGNGNGNGSGRYMHGVVEPDAGWKEVERNREKEGLTMNREWR